MMAVLLQKLRVFVMAKLGQGTEGKEDQELLTNKAKSGHNVLERWALRLFGGHRKSPKVAGYPLSILFILGNEFCERFSFYGMKAILLIYMTTKLKVSDDHATAAYHAFTMLCYFFPLLGGFISDSWLGKYTTIVTLSLIYVVGHVIKSVTSIDNAAWGTVVGLLLIAFGTGGIKPCVSAFGGDQFDPADEVVQKRRGRFFSFFYFVINAGSFMSTMLTPIFRKVSCFGTDSCYFLAFGVPAILMMVATLIFIVGTPFYVNVRTNENIVCKVLKCIWTALRHRRGKREHWMDHADFSFDKAFIDDVKAVLRVVVMLLPAPIFWALFDQQGSRWTLQATLMNGKLTEDFSLKPDQIQSANPLLIMLLIPVFDYGIYPLLELLKIKMTPLKRMASGMVLCALAFFISMLVQIRVENSLFKRPNKGESQILFVNVAPCTVEFNDTNFAGNFRGFEGEFKNPKKLSANTLVRVQAKAPIGCPGILGGGYKTSKLSFNTPQANGTILYSYVHGRKLKLGYSSMHLKHPHEGKPTVKVLYSPGGHNATIAFKTLSGDEKENRNTSILAGKAATDSYTRFEPGRYDIEVLGSNGKVVFGAKNVKLDLGGVYVLAFYEDSTTKKLRMARHVEVTPNSVPMLLQLPQYFVMTSGEVMFSISGLSFAYAEAPESLRSVMQAVWLLTVAFGSVIVIIVTGARLVPSRVWEFFTFAILMCLTTCVFVVMSTYYKYVEDTHGVNGDMNGGTSDIALEQRPPEVEEGSEEGTKEEHSQEGTKGEGTEDLDANAPTGELTSTQNGTAPSKKSS